MDSAQVQVGFKGNEKTKSLPLQAQAIRRARAVCAEMQGVQREQPHVGTGTQWTCSSLAE